MDKAYSRPTARARELRANATDAERVLWPAISARKVAGVRFNRQVPIGPYICDFVSKSLRFIIEVDGGQHSPDVDTPRTAYLEREGYRVLRFWNNDVLSKLDGVISRITDEIANMPSPDPSRMRDGSY